MSGKVKDYWFYNEESGEEFFVECDNVNEAKIIAKGVDEDAELIDIVSPERAEIIGLGTY